MVVGWRFPQLIGNARRAIPRAASSIADFPAHLQPFCKINTFGSKISNFLSFYKVILEIIIICGIIQEPVGPRVFWDLVAKTDAVPWERDHRTVWYVLFSASGFTDDLKALAAQREDLLLFDEETAQ